VYDRKLGRKLVHEATGCKQAATGVSSHQTKLLSKSVEVGSKAAAAAAAAHMGRRWAEHCSFPKHCSNTDAIHHSCEGNCRQEDGQAAGIGVIQIRSNNDSIPLHHDEATQVSTFLPLHMTTRAA